MAIDLSGNFVITWWDLRHAEYDIYAQRYAFDGSPLGNNFKVNDDLGTRDQKNPAISCDSYSNFVITWTDNRHDENDHDIYAQRYTSNGSPVDSNFRVTNTSFKIQKHPDVKLWNNRIYNTWTDNRAGGSGYDIWANVLDWNNPVGIIEKELSQRPSEFNLMQNYPNPFNPITTIEFDLPSNSEVTLKIFNLLGEEIAILLSASLLSGSHSVQWDASKYASGIYLYKLQAGNYVETKKMVLMK